MNKTKSIQFSLMLALAVALCLSFSIMQANAEYSCPGIFVDAVDICNAPLENCDSDADGYFDFEECIGITLPMGSQPGEAGSVTYMAADPQHKMDPKKKDLFLILVRAEESEFCNVQSSLLPPDDELQLLLYPSTNPSDQAGLGLTVHVIENTQAPDGQRITAGQRAVKMTEHCSMDDPDVAGEALRTIPTLGAGGYIYTSVIQQRIDSLPCTDGLSCYDSSGNKTTKAILKNWHMVNTFNHELGHMLSLSVNYDRKAGYHWPALTGNELDQFVKCDANLRKLTATCYISVTHAPPDIGGIKLR